MNALEFLSVLVVCITAIIVAGMLVGPTIEEDKSDDNAA